MMHYLGKVPQTAVVGGKARELDRMIRNGLNVPNGVVFDIDSWDDDAWQTNVQNLEDTLFAVRSSSPTEDTAERSMAGMFSSKTRVKKEDVIAAVQDVLAHAEKLHSTKIPVIVQRWIEGTVSGIAFSQHPTKSLGDVVVIDAAPGTAERIVSGEVTPLRAFLWDDAELVPNGYPLPKQLLKELAQDIRTVSSLLSCPVDIEWTTDGKHIFLLQARPMTHLPKEHDQEREEGRIMHTYGGRQDLKLIRGDYAESIPRPSPAGLDLVRSLFRDKGPFAQATERIGLGFDASRTDAYLTTVFGWLCADAAHVPIKQPDGFFRKISAGVKLQKAALDFPKTFYTSHPDIIDEEKGMNYASAAILADVAQRQKYVDPMKLKEIWTLRTSWIVERPQDIPQQDFELSIDAPIGRRRDWSEPSTLSDLYAVIREDAKDEMRPLFAKLRQAYKDSDSDMLRRPQLGSDLRLPQTLIWDDLFDLQSAYRRELPQDGLHGTGVSDGKVQGTIFITDGPCPVPPSSILVVPSLTPEWFQHFSPEIIGIISEAGSLMSHGAIQCRERGIPAVFGALGASETLKAGETISIDGKTGEIS